MRLLLDTVTFIWFIGSPHRLSSPAAKAIESTAVAVEISSISISEIALKHAKGKLSLPKDNVQIAVERLKLHVLPYTAAHAFQFFELQPHHGDPFDRMIIAQALAEGIPVVTSDDEFRKYRDLEVIW